MLIPTGRVGSGVGPGIVIPPGSDTGGGRVVTPSPDAAGAVPAADIAGVVTGAGVGIGGRDMLRFGRPGILARLTGGKTPVEAVEGEQDR